MKAAFIVVALSLAFSPRVAEGAKKYVLFGWEFSQLKIRELQEKAPWFDTLAVDGVGFAPLSGDKDLEGRPMWSRYPKRAASNAADIGTATVQIVAKIHDVRLAGNAAQLAFPLGQHSSQHGIDRSTNRNDIKIDLCPSQRLCLHAYLALIDLYVCPQRHKCLDMLVDRSAAKIAAAYMTYSPYAKSAKPCTKKVGRGAHAAGQRIRHGRGRCVCGINSICSAVDLLYLCPHATQNSQRQRHIPYRRQIADDRRAVAQQGGHQNGQGSIFGAANAYATV